MKNRNAGGIFYKLFFMAAVFFSGFVLLELSDNFWAIGIAGIVLLIAGYLFLEQSAKEKQQEREQSLMEISRRLDELLNTQRSLYTITKRRNEKMEKISMSGYEDAEVRELLVKLISLQERAISENRKFAELEVNALKTVAKYNKENARQLAKKMNENTDRLTSRLQGSMAEPQEKIEVSAEQGMIREFYQDANEDAAAALEESGEIADETVQVDFVQAEENFAEEQNDAPDPGTELTPEIDSEPERNTELFPEVDLETAPALELPPESLPEVEAEEEGSEISVVEPAPDFEPISIPDPVFEPESIPIPDPETIVDPVSDPLSLPTMEETSDMNDSDKVLSQDDMEALLSSLTK